MCKSKAARQKGITLIEILLVAVIVAASIVGVFMFSKNTRLTAAVSAEQAQVEQTVKTLQGLFANQPNYGSLSASYLNDKASGSGLVFREDANGIVLDSKVGEGRVVVRVQPANVSFPPTGDPVAVHPATDGNAFAISYSNLSTKECVNLTSAVAGSSVLAHAKASSSAAHQIVAMRGKVSDNKDDILAGCATPTSAPTASLVMYFQGSKSAGAALPPSTPLPQCRPVRETQSTGCPAGQSGSIVQERVGNCTGPGNSLEYTAWTTIEDTCALDPTLPPDETPDPIVEDCAETTFTRSTACPGTDIGQIVEARTVNSCDGTSTPWTEVSRTCEPPPVSTPTCTPSSQQQTISCPPGQGGSQVQVRSSSCPTPTSTPVWGPWSTISNNCTSSCAAAGTCCTAQRQTQTVMEPCPTGTYGNSSRDEERFLGCVNATTQAPNWTPWQVVNSSGTCTACPASVTESATRWVSRTQACPSGSGVIKFEAEQSRTRTTSYSCPAGTTSLPAPTVSDWGPWTDTGDRRNVDSSSCSSGCRFEIERADYSPLGMGYPTFWSYSYTESSGANNAQVSCEGSSGYTYPATCSGSGPGFTVSGTYADSSALLAILPAKFEWMAYPDNETMALADHSLAQPVGARIDFGWQVNGTGIGSGSFVRSSSCDTPPASCSVPAGTVFNWTVGSNSCTYTQGSATTIATGAFLTAVDTVGPTTGQAEFSCVAGSPSPALSSTPRPGATCSASTACTPGQVDTEIWNLPQPATVLRSCVWGTPPAATGSSLVGNTVLSLKRTRNCAANGTWAAWNVTGPPIDNGYWHWAVNSSTSDELVNGCATGVGCSGSPGLSIRWVPRSKSCPDGTTHTWEQMQVATGASCVGGKWTGPGSGWVDVAPIYGAAPGTAPVRNIQNPC